MNLTLLILNSQYIPSLGSVLLQDHKQLLGAHIKKVPVLEQPDNNYDNHNNLNHGYSIHIFSTMVINHG